MYLNTYASSLTTQIGSSKRKKKLEINTQAPLWVLYNSEGHNTMPGTNSEKLFVFRSER